MATAANESCRDNPIKCKECDFVAARKQYVYRHWKREHKNGGSQSSMACTSYSTNTFRLASYDQPHLDNLDIHNLMCQELKNRSRKLTT